MWEKVDQKSYEKPCQRSSSASIIHNDCLYIFGGFTFNGRLSEINQYNFKTQKWAKIKTKGQKPTARESNGAIVYDNKMYIFGGYDGVCWLNDFYSFDLYTFEWNKIQNKGDVPSQRFGFASGNYEDKFVIFGGFEGTYWLNDYYEYSFSDGIWRKIVLKNITPSERSCPSYSCNDQYLYIFGGFNGVDKLNDFYKINMRKGKCTKISQKGEIPSCRYFHSQIYYQNKIYIFGGYNGQIRLNDLFEFNIQNKIWMKLEQKDPPAGRSSMIFQVYGNSLFLFGGYNGFNVMNDFYKFQFQTGIIPQSTYQFDMQQLINNKQLSDVQFLVEGQTIYANKCILSIRSEYFKMMFMSGLKESLDTQQPIPVKDVQYDVFMNMITYIYTDHFNPNLSLQGIINLIPLSDQYFLERLKYLCEEAIINQINFINVIDCLIIGQKYRCFVLKKHCFKYVIDNLEEIKKKPEFQKLINEPNLLMEILMNK